MAWRHTHTPELNRRRGRAHERPAAAARARARFLLTLLTYAMHTSGGVDGMVVLFRGAAWA